MVVCSLAQSEDALKADASYDAFGNILDSWNISFYNFSWGGGHGYRQTGLAYSSVYVRARHYSNLDAGWTTRDPLWPSEMPYGYVDGRVPGAVDPSGMLSCRFMQRAKSESNCGDASMNNQWRLTDLPTENDGWIVQHIRFVYHTKDCKGNDISRPNFEYWEAWRVKRGKIFQCDAYNKSGLEYEVSANWPHDFFRTGYHGICEYGTIKIVGKVKFIRGTLRKDFVCGRVLPAGDLYSTPNKPSWWNDSGALDHRMTVFFQCCGGLKCEFGGINNLCPEPGSSGDQLVTGSCG